MGITDLRVRGMWSIENPFKVFDYVYKRDFSKSFNFMCIMNEEKYNSFSNTHLLENNLDKIAHFHMQTVKIKNPNNSASLKNAKLITFQI